MNGAHRVSCGCLFGGLQQGSWENESCPHKRHLHPQALSRLNPSPSCWKRQLEEPLPTGVWGREAHRARHGGCPRPGMVGALGLWYNEIPNWEQREVKRLLGERAFRTGG